MVPGAIPDSSSSSRDSGPIVSISSDTTPSRRIEAVVGLGTEADGQTLTSYKIRYANGRERWTPVAPPLPLITAYKLKWNARHPRDPFHDI